MSAAGPTLVIFLGGLGRSPVEEMVGAARTAAALDSIEAALSTGAYEGAIIVTDRPLPSAALPTGTLLHMDNSAFHFGHRLAGLVAKRGFRSVVYLGGGSLPLLGTQDFAFIARAPAREGVALTNNYFSSDLVAFRPASAVCRIQPPATDNALARALAEGAGLPVRALPRTAATQMDIDGPSDLAILALIGLGGPRLRAYLGDLALDLSRYRQILPLLVDPRAQVVVAGRVGSHVWQYLERETACRVRLFAEERGMVADGRALEGNVRSLLGFYLEAVGAQRFFQALAELGDAAFIDSRVLLAHARNPAGRSDRFLSDLGRWREVGDPFLREFTRAALEAPIPVLLGGHCLVSGGLMALNEFAWQEHELRQQA